MSVYRYLTLLAGGPDTEHRRKYMGKVTREWREGEIMLIEYPNAAYLKNNRTGERTLFTNDDVVTGREEFDRMVEHERLLTLSREGFRTAKV